MPNKVALFAVVALVMLAVPAWMIVKHERILRDGTVYRFRTAPVDPYDPFRGDYVRLEFAAENGKWTFKSDGTDILEQPMFAALETDSSGFAALGMLSTLEPISGDHLIVRPGSNTINGGELIIHNVRLPFDRYYLEEGDGRRAEDLVAGRTMDWLPDQDPPEMEPLPSYAVVRVRDGEAVIEDLMVGDRSIHEWLKEQPVSKQD